MNSQTWFTEDEAAEHIGMSVAFLRGARCRGVIGNRTPPPPHYKIGGAVRYKRTDLDNWIEARRVDPAARRRRLQAPVSI